MEWPIFFKDSLKIGNLESSIGICTLWTKKEFVSEKISNEKYCVCGNLYTVQGINPMIKNILANPKIRYIILCGNDLMGSGEALISFMKNGVENNRKIANSSGYIDSNLENKLINMFRENVQVIDLRGKENSVEGKIGELQDKPPFAEPVFITKLEESGQPLYSEEVGFKVRGETIGETWLKILDAIMKFGEEKPSEYGIKQREIIDLTAVIEGEDKTIVPWLNLAENDLEKYYETFFGGKLPEGVTYTYGERLLNYSAGGKVFNQIEHATKYLKEVPHTRRAIAVTWNIEKDENSKDPPCITQITWNIKNNKLIQTAVIRSNDMFGAWPLNAFALRKLQKEVASKLGIEIGQLIIVSNSAHIYENNWGKCREILNKYYTGGSVPFIQDKNGYFTIAIENGEIVVQHHLPDGRKSNYTFRGTEAQTLYRQIVHENLISLMDHAAYIGHELARAEIALKEKKPFIQDKA